MASPETSAQNFRSQNEWDETVSTRGTRPVRSRSNETRKNSVQRDLRDNRYDSGTRLPRQSGINRQAASPDAGRLRGRAMHQDDGAEGSIGVSNNLRSQQKFSWQQDGQGKPGQGTSLLNGSSFVPKTVEELDENQTFNRQPDPSSLEQRFAPIRRNSRIRDDEADRGVPDLSQGGPKQLSDPLRARLRPRASSGSFPNRADRGMKKRLSGFRNGQKQLQPFRRMDQQTKRSSDLPKEALHSAGRLAKETSTTESYRDFLNRVRTSNEPSGR